MHIEVDESVLAQTIGAYLRREIADCVRDMCRDKRGQLWSQCDALMNRVVKEVLSDPETCQALTDVFRAGMLAEVERQGAKLVKRHPDLFTLAPETACKETAQ